MSGYQTYNEGELLAKVALGDQVAFSKLVAHYTPTVFRYMLIYVKNAHIAEELTQDIFMRMWEKRDKLHDMENFAGYLYVSTRNRALMMLRTRLNNSVEPPTDMLQSLLEDPDSRVELKDLINILNRGIELMPERRREVFKLSRFEHLTYEEIAVKLSISRSAVNQHMNAALSFLRAWLREEAGIILSLLIWLQIGE